MQRARITTQLRAWFYDHDFIEVDTPVAIRAPAPELYIDAPEVTLLTTQGTERRFLQTSPELAMKRLLAGGLARIFQIAAVFRDGDDSPVHRPEFRLLEWYRRGASWTSLLDDCESLLRHLAAAAGHSNALIYQGRSFDLAAPFARRRVDAAFVEHVGFSILDHLDSASLRAALQRAGIYHAADDTWDDLFNRAFVSRIEPALTRMHQPVFLTHYPAPMAALARRDPKDPRAAERFELYIAGLELANGFGELTDANEQRQRFENERAARARAKKRDYPLDERFLTELHALPPSAGIALGLERLLMLLCDAVHIDDVAFVAWSET